MKSYLAALFVFTALAGNVQAQGANFQAKLTDYDLLVDSKGGVISSCGYNYRAVYKDRNGKVQAAIGSLNILFDANRTPTYTHKSIAASYSDDNSAITRRKVAHSAISSTDQQKSSAQAKGKRVEDYYLSTQNLKDASDLDLFYSTLDGFTLSIKLDGQSDDARIDMPSFQDAGKADIRNGLVKCMQKAAAAVKQS